MGDHFALWMDRLITESTLAAAIESRNMLQKSTSLGTDDIKIDCSSQVDSRKYSPVGKIVECRICQEEDEDSNMEVPCSCCGSLKYAHRRCVQRWCNEKGDTMCEICHQPFKPGYTAPPPAFQLGTIPMHFRGNWAIARRDINNHRLIAMVSTDRNLLDREYDGSASRSLFCCHAIALIFMVLLVVRHTLPGVVSGRRDFSLPLFLLFLFRTSGLVLPIYFVVKVLDAVWRRHCRQVAPDISAMDSDEEAGLPPPQNLPPRSIRVH